MTDLVQRLRERGDGYEELEELDEAADEIERLRLRLMTAERGEAEAARAEKLYRDAESLIVGEPAIDFDAIAWAYAKLGDFNELSGTAEDMRMSDRLYSMLRHRA